MSSRENECDEKYGQGPNKARLGKVNPLWHSSSSSSGSNSSTEYDQLGYGGKKGSKMAETNSSLKKFKEQIETDD